MADGASTQAEGALTDGFHLLIDALKLNDLNTIYGVPGIPITDFGRMAQAAGIRVISFRHEQNAGNAAAIAGFLTKKPGVCLTVFAPGFLNGPTALAHATTNCWPMILISGSSEREIVDLMQGDYEEMDQLRALDVISSAKKPLIILGKGAAYAQADEAVKTFVETSGIPYLPMSMAKGLLPDTHELSAGPARSLVLKESDVVIMVGARINWLLSHGKGKQWGAPHSTKFVQIDIEPKEMDSNVEIAAPLVGDIGSVLTALNKGMGKDWKKPPSDWTDAVMAKKNANIEKMAPTLQNNASPMNYAGALGALRKIIAERPDAILVNEGANTLDFARSIIDMYKPRKRLDVGTWGVMGVGMGSAIAAAVETGQPVLAVEGDSAFGFSGMEVETICRYDLPVCIVVFNNNGIYRGTDVNESGTDDPATTVFVENSRYDLMMEAFGGVGVHVDNPDELSRAVNAAMDSGKPTLINAAIDPKAGKESGNIGSLNPVSVVAKK